MSSIRHSPSWRPPAAVITASATFVASIVAMTLLYLPSWRSMTLIWWHNETYTHGMLVPLATIWLAWRARAQLAGLTPQPSLPAIAALAICGAAWLIARMSGVNTIEHFAVVASIPCLFILCFGHWIAWQIAFPLAFLFFTAPFGDFLMPWLMDRTADFTVMAIQLSGIPVYREGRLFVLPSGRWSVVEACSGLRYLLAAIPLGLLYGYLNFRSFRKRLTYLAMVIVLALTANWIRAYLIVMIGHLSSMRLATGVDHLIYGWLFFGIVMGTAFWLGSFVADPDPEPTSVPARSRGESKQAPAYRFRLFGAAATGVLVLALAPWTADTLEDRGSARLDLAKIRAEVETSTEGPTGYRPAYAGSQGAVIGRSRSEPSVWVAVYRYFRQHKTGEMITHGNAVIPVGVEQPVWRIQRQDLHSVSRLPGSSTGGAVNEYEISGEGRTWLVWEWYWIDGKAFAHPRQVKKTATAIAQIAGRSDESATLIVWTPIS
ncbi:MAG: exosortase A, partial [Burkholderiaceae bacterium]|nr:exosortase A [Burkholderiaceae bacterium]